MTAPDNACPVEQVEEIARIVGGESNFDGDRFDSMLARSELEKIVIVVAAALARQRTLPPVAEVMERARDAINAQILYERADEKRMPGYVKINTAARAFAALTNLQTDSAPLTDAGDGGEKG